MSPVVFDDVSIFRALEKFARQFGLSRPVSTATPFALRITVKKRLIESFDFDGHLRPSTGTLIGSGRPFHQNGASRRADRARLGQKWQGLQAAGRIGKNTY